MTHSHISCDSYIVRLLYRTTLKLGAPPLRIYRTTHISYDSYIVRLENRDFVMYEPGQLLETNVGIRGCGLDFLDYSLVVNNNILVHKDFVDGTILLYLGYEDLKEPRGNFQEIHHLAKFLIEDKVWCWHFDEDRKTQLRIHLKKLEPEDVEA